MQGRMKIGVGGCAILLCGTVLALGGCDDMILRASRGYTGPQPSTEPLAEERVVVHRVRTQYLGQIALTVERLRYTVAGDPHNVDRVVETATTSETQDAVASLDLQSGDTVRISTEYVGVAEAGGSMGVPDWPGHQAMEYPIGLHLLTEIAREP